MSDDEIADQQVLGPDEEEILSCLGEQMERCCDQLELDVLHRAGDLLRRETDSLKCGRTIMEAQHRAEFLQRLSSIVTDACSKLESKMRVSSSHISLSDGRPLYPSICESATMHFTPEIGPYNCIVLS